MKRVLFQAGRRIQTDFAVHAKVYSNLRKGEGLYYLFWLIPILADRYTTHDVYAHEVHTREMHAHEVYAYEVYAHEVHAMRYKPIRCTPRTYTPIRRITLV